MEVREVWCRYGAGEDVRAIARGTGVDRKTIAKDVAEAPPRALYPSPRVHLLERLPHDRPGGLKRAPGQPSRRAATGAQRPPRGKVEGRARPEDLGLAPARHAPIAPRLLVRSPRHQE